jgi:molybdopterin-guanine dinucleotide biosynthesis protein A
MGRAKAWLPWFGKSMIEHVVGRLQPVVDEVIVVASQSMSLPPLPARVVEDREPALGPLAGIREGLEATDAELVFVTSTDAPFLTTDHVLRMFEFGVAVAPRAGGHVQVLSAIYPSAAWKDAADLLRHGQRRPVALLERIDAKMIDYDDAEDRASPNPWQGFNTAEEYLHWARSTVPDAKASIELLGRAALAAEARHFEVPIGTLGEVLRAIEVPDALQLFDGRRLARPYLASLGGRDLVRDLDLPVGPGERVSVIDALAGG